MPIVRWDPWRELGNIVERYDRALHQPRLGSQEVIASGDWAPKVDIIETEKLFLIKVEIPEIKKEDVKVSVNNGTLTIRGERKEEVEEKGKKIHRIERYHGLFTRSFTLPDNADKTNIKALFSNGMLNLEILKTEEKKSNDIEITVE
ncbi:Hsp20/alpha crystallin family protein [Desulfogranum marinum]|uniref:Hsp20/alpha crystallin family protein n=1 Tax=Desulfogranum marinum TaxID=453220 RepID=UPI0019638C8E|nr:Hsp20/alpha crystallin family protein [Desulfogranum marinum]MBM9511915.1 Hsp20/alpha crystallin family protein [Desulfogranum marinum]